MNLQLLAKQLKANAYAAMDSDLKLARGMAHAKFDLIWQRKLMTRRKAYLWLQQVMKMTEAQAHMEHMDATQCMQVIDQVNKAFPWLR